MALARSGRPCRPPVRPTVRPTRRSARVRKGPAAQRLPGTGPVCSWVSRAGPAARTERWVCPAVRRTPTAPRGSPWRHFRTRVRKGVGGGVSPDRVNQVPTVAFRRRRAWPIPTESALGWAAHRGLPPSCARTRRRYRSTSRRQGLAHLAPGLVLPGCRNSAAETVHIDAGVSQSSAAVSVDLFTCTTARGVFGLQPQAFVGGIRTSWSTLAGVDLIAPSAVKASTERVGRAGHVVRCHR